jgi:hypothetical protein
MYNLWFRLVGRMKLIPEIKEFFSSTSFLNEAAK